MCGCAVLAIFFRLFVLCFSRLAVWQKVAFPIPERVMRGMFKMGTNELVDGPFVSLSFAPPLVPHTTSRSFQVFRRISSRTTPWGHPY